MSAANPSAEAEFDAAMAELNRARGLLTGPRTAAKKALLLDRVRSAGRALSRAYHAVAAESADPDPLPSHAPPASGARVIDFTKRRA